MGKGIRKPAASHESERIGLGELIHQHVRLAIVGGWQKIAAVLSHHTAAAA